MPGLAAKPWIDIQVAVRRMRPWTRTATGCWRSATRTTRTTTTTSSSTAGRITSTSALRAATGRGATSPSATCCGGIAAARAAYQEEKLRLAAEHDDVLAYTEAKTPIIRRLQDASILPP